MSRLIVWPRAALVLLAAVLALSAPVSMAAEKATGKTMAKAGGGGSFIPPLAPLPPHPPIPNDNKSAPTVFPAKMDAKQELGYLLFFDTKLSGDSSIACVTCHHPDQGWGFNDPISRGYPGTVHWRNSHTSMNSGYYNKLFWQGSATSLEAQAPAAATGGVAGNGANDMMETRLAFTPEYRKRFKEVFGNEPKISQAWEAIAAFERYTSQPNTPLDLFLKGDAKAISDAAKRGKALFEGKANCLQCHNGAITTDERYYNLGLPQPPEFAESGLQQITFRFQNHSRGVSEKIYRDVKEDLGLWHLSKIDSDKMKFRTAPLRYLKYTAPYMHNGVFFTLDEVVEFYNKGGGDYDPYKTKTKILKPLNLTDAEKKDLIEFLLTMSGEAIKMPVPKIPAMEAMADWEPKK